MTIVIGEPWNITQEEIDEIRAAYNGLMKNLGQVMALEAIKELEKKTKQNRDKGANYE